MPKVKVHQGGKPYIDSVGVLMQHIGGVMTFTRYRGQSASLYYDKVSGLFVVTRRRNGRGYRSEEVGTYPDEGAACRAVATILGLEIAPEVLPWPERNMRLTP